MPALLRKLGYRNADISIRHYTDPYDLNLQEGFDYANERRIERKFNSNWLPSKLVKAFAKELYFFENSFSRLSDRILHAFSVKYMVNPYKLVSDKADAIRYYPDEKRMDQLFNFIEESEQPFFAHVHLMGTHGPKFSPNLRNFSLNKEQIKSWMPDFYDDAVFNYDSTVERTVKWLKDRNLYENTLLVLTSDHGSRWTATERIPLILRFPNQEFKGVRQNNVQRVDLSATLLDYLELDLPEWLDGDSFLHQELPRNRPLFYVDSAKWGKKDSGGWRIVKQYQAPYYSLGGVGVIIQNNWYFLDTIKNELSKGLVASYRSGMPKEGEISDDSARKMLIEHLESYGLPDPRTIQN